MFNLLVMLEKASDQNYANPPEKVPSYSWDGPNTQMQTCSLSVNVELYKKSSNYLSVRQNKIR